MRDLLEPPSSRGPRFSVSNVPGVTQFTSSALDESGLGCQDGLSPCSTDPNSTVDPLTKRILVVDDEKTIRQLIADTLNEFGYDVKTAYNGAEALEVMRRWLPHAIVLDLMMPRLDGSGLCEMLRHNPRFASVPVLLVTAAYGAREAAERIGAAAYLTKPFELDTLLEVIDQLVEQRVPLTTSADD